MIKILFICSRNRLRSPTAEVVFGAYPGVETASAGTSPDAETPISADLVEWADLLFAMERVHERRLRQRFAGLLRSRRVVVLGIPDEYKYMDPTLIQRLEQTVTPYLRGAGNPPQARKARNRE